MSEKNTSPLGKKKASATIEEQLQALQALAEKMRSPRMGVQEAVKCLEQGLSQAKSLEEALNEIDKQVASICADAGVDCPAGLRT